MDRFSLLTSDYHYTNRLNNMLMYGGHWGEDTRGGIFSTDNDYDLAYSNGFWLGSRLTKN